MANHGKPERYHIYKLILNHHLKIICFGFVAKNMDCQMIEAKNIYRILIISKRGTSLEPSLKIHKECPWPPCRSLTLPLLLDVDLRIHLPTARAYPATDSPPPTDSQLSFPLRERARGRSRMVESDWWKPSVVCSQRAGLVGINMQRSGVQYVNPAASLKSLFASIWGLDLAHGTFHKTIVRSWVDAMVVQ